jgi:hypoxanthine phosphoribosyltransferase
MTAPGESVGAPWKGLDTGRMPVFISYDQVERMVAALLPAAAKFQPDAVVGIVRGGLVPATMAAGILALPLSFLTHDRTSGAVSWIGPPASGRRILLVDDCCSTGTTLQRARAKISGEGRECMTLVVVHDPDVARYLPDLSHPMRDLFRLPWERGEATPTGRAAKSSGATTDPSAEAPFVGLGLDFGLLTKLMAGPREESRNLPVFPPERTVLISGIPESERTRIAASLAASPYGRLPLEFRPDAMADDRASLARFKAETATRWGCTHFIDCDAEQAIGISGHAPHLVVSWWSVPDGKEWVIGAAARPRATILTGQRIPTDAPATR